MLVPVVLMLLAVIIGVVFNFNLGKEFKETYSFTIKYNSSVSNEQYEDYLDQISSVLNNHTDGKFSYKFEKLNEEIALQTKVTIYNTKLNSIDLQNKFIVISGEIKDVVNASIGNGHIEISELNAVSGISFTNEVVKTLLALTVLAIVMFAYIWFRYQFKMALCSLLLLPYNVGTLMALMVLFRLPVNTMFTIPFFISTILSYIVFVILADKIREYLEFELLSDAKNEEMLANSLQSNKNILSILLISFSVSLLLAMLSLSANVIFTSILALIGVVVAVCTAVPVSLGLWMKVYNKANDKRLKAKKLKKEQTKTKKSAKTDAVV